MINNKKAEIADRPFFPFNGKNAYRAVVQRCKRKDMQLDAFTQSPYSYYAVMTNNKTPTATNLYITEFITGVATVKETLTSSIMILIVTVCLSLFLMPTWFTSLLLPSALLSLNG
ncbi:MAG: hypothetical protein WKG06_17225 [Segetibacter sp.]